MGIIKGRWGIRGNELQRIFDKIPATYINYDKNLLNRNASMKDYSKKIWSKGLW